MSGPAAKTFAAVEVLGGVFSDMHEEELQFFPSRQAALIAGRLLLATENIKFKELDLVSSKRICQSTALDLSNHFHVWVVVNNYNVDNFSGLSSVSIQYDENK